MTEVERITSVSASISEFGGDFMKATLVHSIHKTNLKIFKSIALFYYRKTYALICN
jgi:hypothetical protein